MTPLNEGASASTGPGMKLIHLIGVPLDLGGNRRGTDMGPSAFRIAGINEQLTRLGLTIVDKGDIVTPIPETKGAGDVHKRYVKEIARVCQKLFQTALASFEEGALPLVLGGDHSLGAGSVAAAAAFYRKRGERSEEHTFELQSRQYLVCRLLLEKKKTKKCEQLNNCNIQNHH